MANDVIAQLKDLLNEEKWTRATIDNYTRKNFIKLDNMVEEAIKEGLEKELKEACTEHLKHSANSVISLYALGILNYENRTLDRSFLHKAITLFRDNKKWTIVEFLAERILGYEEDKRALKSLAAVYQSSNQEEELWKVQERLIKVDHGNHEVARKLAAHHEAANPDLAVYYIKLALKRILMQGDWSLVEEAWKKLVELVPEDLEFFFSLEPKLRGKMPDETVGALYMELLPAFEGQDVETQLAVLRAVLRFSPKSKQARTKLVALLRKKYEGHSRLEETLTLAAFEMPIRPFEEAWDVFIRNIAFDAGDWVYHRSWGIGQIVAIDGDVFVIDFDTKKGHRMEMEMVLKSLSRLDKEHLWIRARLDKDGLRKEADTEPETFLRRIFASFGKELPLKDIKAECVSRGVFTDSQWTTWWNKAKKIFKTNPEFGASTEKKNVYFLRDKPISLEEDSLKAFENEKDFYKKLSVFEDFLAHSSDYTTTAFQRMLAYFRERAAAGDGTPQSLDAVLFLYRLAKQLAGGGESVDLRLAPVEEFYASLGDPVATYEKLTQAENRKLLLQIARRHDPRWDEFYAAWLRLPPGPYDTRMLDELTLNDRVDKVRAHVTWILDHWRENLDHLVWLGKLFYERLGREDAPELDEASLLVALLGGWARAERDVLAKTNVAVNRKRASIAKDLLFGEKRLAAYVANASDEAAARIVAALPQVTDVLEDSEKGALTGLFREKHPSLEFSFGSAKTEVPRIHAFLVTQAGMDVKQAEFKHLVEIDIPENSKDIAHAVERGDLSENAEYKAALEHQEQLKARVTQLDGELKNAKIFGEHEVTLDHVGFGNVVKLLNLGTKQEEELTILGEWESDPSKHILSYKSPLGNAMLFKKIGEEFELAMGTPVKYKVLEIRKASVF